MMETWWIVQGVGFLALLLNCGAFLCKTRRSIIAVQIVSSLIWAVHFELLDARTAVLMNILGAARQSVFFFRERYRWADSRWWPAGFCLIFVVGGFLSWQSFSSLLPMAAMLFGTLAAWQVETWKLRLLGMFPPPLWFFYNLIHHSLAGLLAEVILISVQAAGYFLHERRKPSP